MESGHCAAIGFGPLQLAMTYIVIFETDNPTVDGNVAGAIKAFGDWAMLTSQSYLLDTTEAVRTVMEALQPM